MMEIYDECQLCGKWRDLACWRDMAWLCNDCMNVVITRAPFIQGKHLTNNLNTFNLIKQETKDGKAST